MKSYRGLNLVELLQHLLEILDERFSLSLLGNLVLQTQLQLHQTMANEIDLQCRHRKEMWTSKKKKKWIASDECDICLLGECTREKRHSVINGSVATSCAFSRALPSFSLSSH